ncbi:MAG: GWxTD domain-containing protein [Bacteroidetes bacterium]|nr:GWxTD domain-containing protein [Bacteroidota bacterium]
MKRIIIYSLVSFAFFVSCKSSQVDKKNTSLYKKLNIDIDVKYILNHETDSLSRLYFAINNAELTYKKEPSDSIFKADLELFCSLKSELTSKIAIDTFTIFIKDKQRVVKPGTITGSRLMKIKSGAKYVLSLELKDINRKAMNTSDLGVSKLSIATAQNYIVKEQDSSIVFDNYTFKKRNLLFKNKRLLTTHAFVSYAKSVETLPPPPFSNVEIKQEQAPFATTTKVQSNFEGWFPLNLEQEGIYFLRTDSLSNQGCTMFLFGDGFPKVTSHKQMIESIRFITSKDEYENLISATDKQKAIEEFWIKIGGSTERAKQLIKNYYGRVQYANEQFATDKEGWRTDRGMIYIIYGAPTSVYQTADHETWIYGDSGSPFSTTFQFENQNNMLSNNVFILRRDPMLKNSWYVAVDAWREGRIYSEN